MSCPHTFHGTCGECSLKQISVSAYEKIDKELCDLWETIERTRDNNDTFFNAKEKFAYVRAMLHGMVKI